MECQGENKMLKVYDASRRKRSRKRREERDATSHSPVSDGSTSGSRGLKNGRPASAVASVPDGSATQLTEIASDVALHRRKDLSLALKAGRASTRCSSSPTPCESRKREETIIDNESRIDVYACIEDAIKNENKYSRRHSRRHDIQNQTPDREPSRSRKSHHRHRHRECSQPEQSRHNETSVPVTQITEAIVESFAKLYAQINENNRIDKPVLRTISHKSLQCLVDSDVDHRPVRLGSREHSPGNLSPASRVRSNITLAQTDRCKPDKSCYCHKDTGIYISKSDLRPRGADVDYGTLDTRTRSRIEVHKQASRRHFPEYGYRDREYESRDARLYEGDKKRICEPKTSRSFDVDRERYADENVRKTHRSDQDKYEYTRRKRYDERKYEDERRDKFYDERHADRDRYKDKERMKRIMDCDRMSVVSRDDDFRDRLSERERDSGLSVADGASTVSGKSNYLRFVKLEIAQQREAMDKMMKLWKDLMKCFKGISQPQDENLKNANETAKQARDSAASQLRLWRECMQRYETVARDVGDTDTRLMEEINKQRSEMAEMATMWQECLQRYREMSNDFNDLKQKLDKPESPSRVPASSQMFADGEHGVVQPPPVAPYRVPQPYPPPPPQVYMGCGSPLRTRASAPPPWSWWEGQGHAPPPPQARPPRPRRQSSLDSRGSPSRDRRRRSRSRPRDRRKDKDYNKEKSSKPNAPRSEHRSRKR